MKFKKNIPKTKKIREKVVVDVKKVFLFVVVALVLAYLLQIFMYYQQANSSKSKNPLVDYEEENGMPILKVDDSTVDYYQDKEWTLNIGLDGMSGTKTAVTTYSETLYEDFDYSTDDNIEVQYNIDVEKDENGYSNIKLYTDDKMGGIVSTEINIVDNSIMALLLMVEDDDSNNVFKSYLESEYKESEAMYDIENLTMIYDFLNTIKETDVKNYDIVFNCRTVFNDSNVDDVTVYFNDEEYGLRVFVDSDTHKIIRVISCMMSYNDYTDVSYDKVVIDNFTADETKGSKSYLDNELVALSDGNIGCKLDNYDMGFALTLMCKISSYNNILLIDINNYTIESEVESIGEQ